MPDEFHFLRPYWFIALIPLVILLWYLARQHLFNRHWESVCDPELLPYILVGRTGSRSYRDIVLLGLVLFVTIIALAGPSWEKLPQPVFQKQSALVIALDLSYSMYADDIKPSRLDRARFEISDLLDQRKEGQTALIVYAGDAFTVTPLTDDIKTIKSQLSALSPDIMPAPGSNTSIVLDKANDLLVQAGHSQGHILLITDEVDEKYQTQFEEIKNKGYQVSILAIGTEQGAPVKLSNGGFLEDRSGAIVIPKLNISSLQMMANRGGGQFQLSQINDDDIKNLNQLFNLGNETKEDTESEFDTDQWQEFGPWLILLIIPFMALAFRKGYLSILLCIFIIQPDQAMALDWDALWLNKDQRAMRAFENDQAEEARDLFENQDWKAAASYKSGDYATTEELLNQFEDTRSLYNKANAMAKQGKYSEALATYEKVLEQQPKHEDALFNKELIEKELQNQKQNQQQSQSDQQKEQDSSDQSNQADSDSNQQQEQQAGQENSEQQSRQQNAGKQQESNQGDSDKQEQGQEQSEQNQAQKENIDEQDKNQKMEEQQPEEEKSGEQQLAQQMQSELDEEQQASEQWLRRIPDDPAGLLRRKFKYQYQQNNRQTNTGKYW